MNRTFRTLRMRTVAGTTQTNGAFELVEDTRDVGQGPAPHIHRRSDEAFYVLEGRFSFTLGDAELSAGPGELVFIPKGSRHFYRALEQGSRVLILYVPAGGFEDFMLELDALMTQGLTSAEAIDQVAGKYDSEPA